MSRLGLVHKSLACLFLFYVALMVHYGLSCFWNTGFYKLWQYGSLVFFLGTGVFVASIPYLFRGCRELANRIPVDGRVPMLLFGVFGFIYIAVAAMVHVEPRSDFATYWECGWALAEGRQPQTWSPLPVLRAIPYTFPVQLLFGHSLLAVRFVNVFLILSAAALFYWGVRAYSSTRVAFLATTFFLLWPDTLLAIPMPSHDIPTLFWFSIMLVSFGALERSLSRCGVSLQAAVLSSTLGTTFFVLDIQRSYGLLITVGVVVYFGMSTLAESELSVRWVCRRAIFCLLIPLLVAWLARGVVMDRFEEDIPDGSVPFLAIVTAIDSNGTGLFSDIRDWVHRMFPVLPDEFKGRYLLKKVTSETLDGPSDFLLFLARRNSLLAQVDGYTYYYSNSGSLFFKVFTYLSSWYVGFLSFFSVIGLYSATRKTLSADLQLLLVLSATMYSAVWLVGEIAGRYDIFLAFTLSVLAALGLAAPAELWQGVKHKSTAIAVFIASLVFVQIAVPIARSSGLFFFNLGSEEPEVRVEEGITYHSTPRSMRFHIDSSSEEDEVSARITLTLPRVNVLTLFLTPRFTKRPARNRAGQFRVRILGDGQTLHDKQYSHNDSPEFLELIWPQAEEAKDRGNLTVEVTTREPGLLSQHSDRRRGGFLSLDLLDVQSNVK